MRETRDVMCDTAVIVNMGFLCLSKCANCSCLSLVLYARTGLFCLSLVFLSFDKWGQCWKYGFWTKFVSSLFGFDWLKHTRNARNGDLIIS